MGSYDKCSMGIYHNMYKIQILNLKDRICIGFSMAHFKIFIFSVFFSRENEKLVRFWSLSLLRVLGSPRRASINPLFIQHHFGRKLVYSAKILDRIGKTWIIILVLPLTSCVTWGKILNLSVSLLQLSRPARLIPFCCAHYIPTMLPCFRTSNMLNLFLCTCCFLFPEYLFPKSALQVSE